MARMTIHEAATAWGVNRRTILRWITGKDATGRGKRLVEGQDYEIVDGNVPGRKMYMLLRETYPMPSTEPIPFLPRGTMLPAPEVPEVAAESIRPSPEPMPKPELEPEVVEEPEPEPVEANRYAIAAGEKFPEGTPIREQIAAWMPTLTKNPDYWADPVGSTGIVVGTMAAFAADESSLINFTKRGQARIERGLHRVLDPSPLSPKAQKYVGGLVLEWLAKWHPLTLSDSQPHGYWPKAPVSLSGLASFDEISVDELFPPEF